MRGSFNFFWEQANTDPTSKGYGLIRDRYPGSPGIASIASVGFGLTALAIGADRGYITREQGYERANGTLDTLLRLERTHGFYYHFLDMETGARAWNSEVSNIDTAILLMGAITAGEYFGGDVKAKAEQINDAVEWDWFYDATKKAFWMGYKPEEGFYGHWDFYAEQLMMYVLAAGSDAHPVGPEAYYSFTRHYGKFDKGREFINSWFGSIFTYQFSHAWIDFKPYTDRLGVNWHQNSVDASIAHVDYATVMEPKYETLSPDAWGLTACDGPKGYEGRYGAPPSDTNNTQYYVDDTVPPCGAIGSIIFVPEDAKRAMLNYYGIERLRSEYGFLDAYNLAEDWYATDVIGIDKGISLLMLANYQDGFVHNVAVGSERLLNGLARLELKKQAE